MKYTAALAALFATLAAAAPTPVESRQAKGTAILQFEIDNDTFTSNTKINVPGTLQFNNAQRPLRVIAATVATTQNIANPAAVRCQAFDKQGKAVGPKFGNDKLVKLAGGKKVEVGKITCQ
ncbi:hypothetical protein RB595_005226 [Gaeumannomyces hyphopodioides]